MYIAVILENYSQATEDVQEGKSSVWKHSWHDLSQCLLPGITDEDYDLFYEIWQEFDPDGTQYIDYKGLSEFLDVLEAPLQVICDSRWQQWATGGGELRFMTHVCRIFRSRDPTSSR